MVTIRTLDNGIRVALESISYVRSISFGDLGEKRLPK